MRVIQLKRTYFESGFILLLVILASLAVYLAQLPWLWKSLMESILIGYGYYLWHHQTVVHRLNILPQHIEVIEHSGLMRQLIPLPGTIVTARLIILQGKTVQGRRCYYVLLAKQFIRADYKALIRALRFTL